MAETETMGQRLQRLRRAAGLTQAELAERAGVPLRSLLNWEQDRRLPRLDAVIGLARELRVRVEDLAVGVAPRDQRPPRPMGRPPDEVRARAAGPTDEPKVQPPPAPGGKDQGQGDAGQADGGKTRRPPRRKGGGS